MVYNYRRNCWQSTIANAVTTEYKFTGLAKRIGYDTDRVQLLKFAYESPNAGLSANKMNKFHLTYVDKVPGRILTYLGRTYTVPMQGKCDDYDIVNLTPIDRYYSSKTSSDLGTIALVEEEIAESPKTFVSRC